METPPPITAVLAAVNELRAEYDLGAPLIELPTGVPVMCAQCPIARALGCTVTGRWFVLPTRPLVPLPEILRDFVAAFDLGLYPELIEP